MNNLLIYGAYGYTGQLIVEEAVKHGLKPILAGRNEFKLKELATLHNLDYRTFDLHEKEKLYAALEGVMVVIHCAGPFSATAISMAEACIFTKTHYIDITGEYKVFQNLHALDSKAEEAGIMLLPGAGFDVVPSDCLAKKLNEELPDATNLLLAFTSLGGGVSRGTAKTMIEGSSEGQYYREEGILKSAPLGQRVKEINYGPHKQLSVAISWGDISTAYFSTRIPNIEVYTGSGKKQITQLRWMHRLRSLMKIKFVKEVLNKQVDKRPAGPSEEKRTKSKTYLYGRAWNDKNSKELRLVTPNGYTLTAESAVLIAKKILTGNYKNGYQTPSSAFGAELILEISGCQFFKD